MRKIRIGKTELTVIDYECSQDGRYLLKEQLRLWLYVILTDSCNAACPFCVNPSKTSGNAFDVATFSLTLERIVPFISGISLTGGEPMLDTRLVEDVVAVVREKVDPSIELDLVTNGTNLNKLPDLKGLERFTTIHLSRHAPDDATNRQLMRWKKAPSSREIEDVFKALPDSGCTVLNCVLQHSGVHDIHTASAYLEFAAEIGAANVSFIGMFPSNVYCRERYVSPLTLGIHADDRYTTWNNFHDHEFCHCSTGDYRAKRGYIRFYYRCPSLFEKPDYCRQLVYGSDNVLRQGFGIATEVEL